jgi:hypothetical protein
MSSGTLQDEHAPPLMVRNMRGLATIVEEAR